MRLVLVLLCCCYGLWGQAQTRQELEKKRQSVSRALSKTNRQLRSTQQRQTQTQQQLRQLRQHLAEQTARLDSLKKSQSYVSTRHDQHTMVVDALEIDLVTIRQQYRQAIRNLYKQHQLERTTPVLARSNQGTSPVYRLYKYCLQNQRYTQIHYIQQVQQDLASSAQQLRQTQAQQDTLLLELNETQDNLSRDQRRQTRQMSRLKQQERRLRRTLAQQKKSKQVLSKKIEAAILQQIATAKAEAREYQAQQKRNTQSNHKNTAPARLPSNRKTQDFTAQKGKLLSPIYHGKIVGRYGQRTHPTFRDVTINNNGIDIQGQYNSVVRNVYTGKVVSIFTVPGMNNAVMVKHGHYYTTYSNIAKVYVKQGQILQTGGQIGTIGRDPKGTGYLLHFELWHNKQKQNPLPWIHPKGRL